MDGELLRWLYHRLLHDPSLHRTRDCIYCDGLIFLIYFYGALFNRSSQWAIDRRKKPFTGLGHHRRHCDRLRAIAELEQLPDALRAPQRIRAGVERRIGHLTNMTCGLWALPGFVRRLKRVRRCVAAKILMYHLHHVLRLTALAAA